MTHDEIDLQILRAVARGLSSPMRERVARLLGILPPIYDDQGDQAMSDRATHIALTTAQDVADLNPLRALWCAVLFESLREALGMGANTRVGPWAHLWPGSRDFCEVCDLAGIDAGRVLTFYRKCRNDADFARERLSIKNSDKAGERARRRWA